MFGNIQFKFNINFGNRRQDDCESVEPSFHEIWINITMHKD